MDWGDDERMSGFIIIVVILFIIMVAFVIYNNYELSKENIQACKIDCKEIGYEFSQFREWKSDCWCKNPERNLPAIQVW